MVEIIGTILGFFLFIVELCAMVGIVYPPLGRKVVEYYKSIARL